MNRNGRQDKHLDKLLYDRAFSRAASRLRREYQARFDALLAEEMVLAKSWPDLLFQAGQRPGGQIVRVPKGSRRLSREGGICVDCRGRCDYRADRCLPCSRSWIRAGRPQKEAS